MFRKNSEYNKGVAAYLQEELKAEFNDEYADNIIQSIIFLYYSISHQKSYTT